MSGTLKQARTVQETHRRLQRIVREVGVLCRRALSNDAFYPHYLQRIAAALEAPRAAMWIEEADGSLVCRWQSTYQLSDRQNASPAAADRERRVRRALSSRDGLVFRTGVYMPLRQGGRVVGVIEVHKPATSDAAAARKWLRFVQHMALLANERPRQLPAALATSAAPPAVALGEFTQSLHRGQSIDETSYAVVNELRRYLQCDRVSLILLRQGRPRLQAISGQAVFNRRSSAVRQLEALAASCSAAIDPLWFDRDDSTTTPHPNALPPCASELSAWKALGIVPLRARAAEGPIGLLIVEHLAPNADAESLERQTELAQPQVNLALSNAMRSGAWPLAAWWATSGRWLRGGTSLWKRRAAYLLVALAAIVFLATFPVRFQVHARGTLRPSVERDVFADVAGVVRHVHVEHGDFVQAGDALAELHNSDLEIVIAELIGSERAAREQLAAVQRQRHDARTADSDRDRLASESLRLQEHLRSVAEQLALLHAQREQLVVRSPIAGQVVTWNVDRNLRERPVSVGQVLLTVADPSSPWELELFAAEADIGHLSTASESQTPPLAVSYLAATEPTRQHSGTLRHIESRAQLHDEHEHSVRLLVDIERADVAKAAVGTTVTARIDCGQRAIGYVWLHRLFEFVYTKVLFRVI